MVQNLTAGGNQLLFFYAQGISDTEGEEKNYYY